MALHFENFGLDLLYEDSDACTGMGLSVAEKGKTFTGYYGIPYLYRNFGDMELIDTVEKKDDKTYEIVRMDSHCRGNCVWDAVLSEINVNPKDQHPLHQRVMIDGANGMQNMAIVDLIHADVLPSFTGGDVVRMQVVAFPKYIALYQNEDDYMQAQSEWQGKKLGLADGFIAPTGFMKNHDPKNPDCEKNPDADTLHALRGAITGIYWGKLELGEFREDKAFLKIFVRTRLGELQLVCSPEQIREEDRELLHPGTILSTVAALSGDVAVDAYENGMVLNVENNLSLIRYSMLKGDPERLRSALAEDVVYRADVARGEFHGREAVILRIQYVKENADSEYRVEKGTVTAVDEGDEILSYGAGTRCLILYAGDGESPESFLFIETDRDGRIARVHTTYNDRYHVRADDKPVLKDPKELLEEE